MKKTERLGNYELMRVIAALFIILNHIDICSELVNSNSIGIINTHLVLFFHIGGKFGTNLFVFLGGWFIFDKPLKIGRIIRLYADVIIYGSIMYVVAILYKGELIGLNGFIHSYSYWFPFAYALALLAAPIVYHLSRNYELLRVIVYTGAVIFSIVTILSGLTENYVLSLILKETIIGPIWFVYIFFVINYLRVKEFKIQKNKTIKYLFLGIASYISMFLIAIFFDFWEIRDMYSPLCFIATFSTFCFFSCLNISMTKALNIIAMSSFGTYLIQCNNNMRSVWNDEVFRYTEHANNVFFGEIVIISILMYFTISIMICLLKRLIARYLFKYRK